MAVELLQLRRSATARISPLSWHPVLGHIEPGETAVEAICREMEEETSLDREARLGFWQLEQVHPFFVAATNTIYFCPRFAVEVASTWEPRLNEEHDASRWIVLADAAEAFVWPGQRAAITELIAEILDPDWGSTSSLRLE
jgi:8-oxo-dGTP pyrophosphatase MutT (NUDIX family)